MREQSNEILSPTRPVAISTPVTNWLKLFGPAAADGAAVADPYDATGFATLGKELHVVSTGRMLLNRRGQGRLEILPLLATAEATVTFQLWAFDWLPAIPKAFTDSDLHFPQATGSDGHWGIASGLPYNMAFDEGLPTTASFGPLPAHETQSMTISFGGTNNVYPYNDQGGTTYFYGSKLKLDASGVWGVFPWVTAISAGNAVLLGRFV